MEMSDTAKIEQLGGKIKDHGGISGVWFNGLPEEPENTLFIPLYDFGYTKQHGIFRKSSRPYIISEINL